MKTLYCAFRGFSSPDIRTSTAALPSCSSLSLTLSHPEKYDQTLQSLCYASTSFPSIRDCQRLLAENSQLVGGIPLPIQIQVLIPAGNSSYPTDIRAIQQEKKLPSCQPSQSAGQRNPSIDQLLSPNVATSSECYRKSSQYDHFQSSQQGLIPMERWVRESAREGPWNGTGCLSSHPSSGETGDLVG